MAPQVMQFPQSYQTVPVQIPVSQNGQTVYQTVQMQMPVQGMQAATAVIPQIVQTSAGQQIVMQQVMQPQFQPQMAQVLTPNGQIQQVQVINGMPGMQMLGGGIQGIQGIQGASMAMPVQIQQQPSTTTQANSGTSTTSTTFSTGTTTTSTSAAASGLLQPKQEPVDTKPESESSQAESSDDEQPNVKRPITSQADVASLLGAQQPVQIAGQVQFAAGQQQQAQQVMTMPNGQQVIVQQPAAMPQAQVLSVKTQNGQVVQIPNNATTAVAGAQAVPVSGAAANIAATPGTNSSTIHIPGLGNVQVVTGAGVQQLAAAAANATAVTPQVGATAAVQAAAGIPQGAQVISPGGQIATFAQPAMTQQALQQDPNDPNKWHVVQVPVAQPAQIATAANFAGQAQVMQAAPVQAVVQGNDYSSAGQSQPAQKTRLRRVACTCPNCKDGDRTRGK